MFKKLADAALYLKEKADLDSKLEATKNFAKCQYEAGKVGTNTVWEKHLPTVERILVEGLLSIAEEKLRDGETLEKVFNKLYETLPLAARLVLSRERFLEFTMARRDPLLLKVLGVRAQRANSAVPLKLEGPKNDAV